MLGKGWLIPIAVFLAGCLATSQSAAPKHARSRMADDNLRLAEADGYVLRLLASNPACAEQWRGRRNWEEGLVFRVAPIPANYAAINFCNKRNRVFVSLLHVDDMDTRALARIIVHESEHQAYCDERPGDGWDRAESELRAMTAERACFPPEAVGLP